MLEHKDLPFSHLHKAKFDFGLAADLPGAAEGVGDSYLATDSGDMYLCLSGTAWTIYAPASLPYIGTKRQRSTASTIPGDDSTTYFDWNTVVWEVGGSFGTGSNFDQPSAGIYEYQLNLILENTAAGRWHCEVAYDLGTVSEQVDFNTDGGGNDVILHLSSQFAATLASGGGGAVYVYLYQDSGSNQDVRAYSSITLKRIADSP